MPLFQPSAPITGHSITKRRLAHRQSGLTYKRLVLVASHGEFMQLFTAARAVSFAALVLLVGCSESPQKQASAPPPPAVTVANPVKRVVIDQDEYVGRFVAVDSVEIRARVSGYLDRIDFTDGQMVKQGDLLFTIDKRPFQTTLDQVKANLAQARANLAFAEGDLGRAAQLVRDKTITEQTFDQRTQAKRVAEESGDRRDQRQHDHARDHRLAGPDPFRVHLR